MQTTWDKVVPPKEFTLKKVWNLFFNQVLVPGGVKPGSIQAEEMEKAYYAGFLECFSVMSDYSATLSEDDACELFEKIREEGMKYMVSLSNSRLN